MKNISRKTHFMVLIMALFLLLLNTISIAEDIDRINPWEPNEIVQSISLINQKGPNTITIEGSNYVAKGKKISLVAVLSKEDAGQKVSWTSSDPGIATVNSKGIVAGKKAGKVKITAATKAHSKSITVHVMAEAAKKIEISGAGTLNLSGSKTLTLKAKVTPAKAAQKVIWKSSNKKVAKVNSKGVVTAIRKGTAKITAVAVDGSGKTASIEIKVIKAKESIKIEGSKYVAKGKKITLKATVSPAEADQRVVWKSSNEKVATVSTKGVVKGVKAGTAKITAISKTNNKIKKAWKIQVTSKPVKKIQIKADTTVLSLEGIKKLELKAKAIPTKAAQSFIWKSSNPAIAKVTSKGIVTAVKPGKVKITVAATDGSKKKASITIEIQEKKTVQEYAEEYQQMIGEGASEPLPNLINQIASEFQLDGKYFDGDKEKIKEAAQKVYSFTVELKERELIKDTTINQQYGTVAINRNNDSIYVYSPRIRYTYSGSEDYGALSVEGLENWESIGLSFYETFSVYKPIGAALSSLYIRDIVPEYTTVITHGAFYCTVNSVVEALQEIKKHNVRIFFWKGHGLAPFTIDGKTMTGFVINEKWVDGKYPEMEKKGWIVETKNEAEGERGNIALTPRFFENYLPAVSGGLFYTGSCYGTADGGTMANTFLNKGFDAYVGSNGSIINLYSDAFMGQVAKNLTRTINGNYVTIYEAMERTAETLGETDWFGTKMIVVRRKNVEPFRLVPSSTIVPTDKPSPSPTHTATPTPEPTTPPTPKPTETPTTKPTATPTPKPTATHTLEPTATPTPTATATSTETPTEAPPMSCHLKVTNDDSWAGNLYNLKLDNYQGSVTKFDVLIVTRRGMRIIDTSIGLYEKHNLIHDEDHWQLYADWEVISGALLEVTAEDSSGRKYKSQRIVLSPYSLLDVTLPEDTGV